MPLKNKTSAGPLAGSRSHALPLAHLLCKRFSGLRADKIQIMETTTKKTTTKKKGRKSTAISHRTTPEIKQMLEGLASRGFRSPARENERLIVDAFEKLFGHVIFPDPYKWPPDRES